MVIKMRDINVNIITQTVADLCIRANKVLPHDLNNLINKFSESEENSLAKSVMNDIVDNISAANELNIPICQDCGMAVIFVEIGQDVHFIGGNFEEAINKGVRKGYTEGYLRCSVVSDPIMRKNTGDNTACGSSNCSGKNTRNNYPCRTG